MFSALTTVRLREAAEVFSPPLLGTKSWMPPDEVSATDLPLAKATEKVLASMHAVLEKTAEARAKELGDTEGDDEDEHRTHLKRTRASEIRVVSCADLLRNPPTTFDNGMTFRAVAVDEEKPDTSE